MVTRTSGSSEACQNEACAIQTCLSKNNYNEARCQQYVESLFKCCDAFYKEVDRNGGGDHGATQSTACPMRSVIERKMKTLSKS